MMMVQELHRVTHDSDVALYDVLPDSGVIEMLIASTSQMRFLLNSPECCGITFQENLSKAIRDVLAVVCQAEDRKISLAMKSSPIDVICILRGSLNFDLHRNLAKITGILPEVTFLSSQRVKCGEGFTIGESSYQKWSLQNGALLCLGDISATATTLKHTLDCAIAHYALEGKKPRQLLILTVGTRQVIHELITYKEKLMRAWAPDFEGLTVVFLEAIFHLYEGDASLSTTHLPFTDFFRKNAPCALEFEEMSLLTPVCFLERCAIYDGGSRAFEPGAYLYNLSAYWQKLANQRSHLDVDKLLKLKSNLMDYRFPFNAWLRTKGWWERMDIQELQRLHEKGGRTVDFLLSKSLAAICEERLHVLSKVRKEESTGVNP